MKPRTLVVLVALVAVLGAFIWFVERDLPSTDERTERAKRVLTLEPEAVRAVSIAAGGDTVRLERAEAGESSAAEDSAEAQAEWRITAPLAARADAAAVDDLVGALTGLEKERTLDEIDPATLGFDEPRAVVTLSAEGEDVALEVGSEVPASSNVLVRRAGAGEAFVVADAFWSDLVKPAGDWRSRRAFPATAADIVEVRLEGAGGPLVLARGSDGFELAEPIRDEADEEKVDDLLAAIEDLEVAEFLDPPQDLAALGLDPAAHTVTVTLVDGAAPISVRLAAVEGDDESNRRAAVDDLVFETETTLGDLVSEPAAAWRSTDWTRLETYEIETFEVRPTAGSALRLERDGGDWLRDGAKIPYAAASDLLYALRDAEPSSVIEEGATAPAGAPLYELTLTAGDRVETLRVWPATEAGHPAEREGRASLLMLPLDAVTELGAKMEAATSAEPLPENEEPAD